jgi:hypothetical protein
MRQRQDQRHGLSPATLVAYISQVMTLEPGDIADWHPAGVGPQPATVEVEIERIGAAHPSGGVNPSTVANLDLSREGRQKRADSGHDVIPSGAAARNRRRTEIQRRSQSSSAEASDDTAVAPAAAKPRLHRSPLATVRIGSEVGIAEAAGVFAPPQGVVEPWHAEETSCGGTRNDANAGVRRPRAEVHP